MHLIELIKHHRCLCKVKNNSLKKMMQWTLPRVQAF